MSTAAGASRHLPDWLVRTVTVTTSAGLLVVAVATSLHASQDAAQTELDSALRRQAQVTVSALNEYFERSRSVVLLLSHDTALRRFASEDTSASEHPRLSAKANDALAFLETLYPGAISEACLIDATGTETARVVRGVIAPAKDLSTEEASAPFFAPTMALDDGRVHQARPYLSPDTDQWVISNSTPIYSEGRPWGLVHFEVSLSSFHPVLDATVSDDAAATVVDRAAGEVVLQSAGRHGPADTVLSGGGRAASEPSAAPRALVDLARRSGRVVSATLDGRRVAVAPVPAGAGNVNAWSVVVRGPVGGLSWTRAVGPAPLSMALAALLLLTFAGMNLRAGHRRLHQASLTDDLTGLPNRRRLADDLEAALRGGRRGRRPCAVLLVDLDRFKDVNDTLGHQYGDRLLRAVAGRLREGVRPSDTVARLGGDEFAVLAHDVHDEELALELAHRLVAMLHEPFEIEGITLDVEASIGIALAPQHGETEEDLMRVADIAMYEAKGRKVGAFAYCAQIDLHAPSRLAMLGELRRALQGHELVMYYQPKAELDTGLVRSAEALVRWQHPERGLLPPAEFLPLAENTGLIKPLTLRTLEMAVEQAAHWHEGGGDVQVAVNLSARCLLEDDLVDHVVRLLEQCGLPPRLLRLEVTESSFMLDPERALVILDRLKAAGVALSLDDFGTGYSSMSYLKRLPVDELKIDRSFVRDLFEASNGEVLVRSSIDLGHNLGLAVVAEGVEDDVTLATLTRMGCDAVQGYHVAAPMPASQLTDWLADRSVRTVTAPADA